MQPITASNLQHVIRPNNKQLCCKCAFTKKTVVDLHYLDRVRHSSSSLSVLCRGRLSWPPVRTTLTDNRSVLGDHGRRPSRVVAVRRRNNSVRVVDASLSTASPHPATANALVPRHNFKWHFSILSVEYAFGRIKLLTSGPSIVIAIESFYSLLALIRPK